MGKLIKMSLTILGIILLTTIVFGVTTDYLDRKDKVGSCYDKFGNEIIGVDCNVKEYTTGAKIYFGIVGVFIILAVILSMLDIILIKKKRKK